MFFKPKTLCLGLMAMLLGTSAVYAQEKAPIKIGVVTFMSGAAAGPFGVPAKNAAELTAEQLNLGKLPAPYQTVGLGGRKIELVYLDENGATSKQVTEYRNLAQREDIDFIVGYTSSGNCLAIAPVAEEMKKLTFFFDCGTPRVFEDANYQYVFRPVAHNTMDNVGAARYVLERKADVVKYAGINQNYAWGQDAWSDFENTLKVLKPGVQKVTSQMPKLGAGQYNAEISALMAANPDVIHSSFWGGDLEGFVLQALPRGLFEKHLVVLSAGETATHRANNQIPTGTLIGARGNHGAFAPESALNTWLRKNYQEKYQSAPSYPSYKMTQTFLGLKAAYEKAMKDNQGKEPSKEQIIKAFEGLSFTSPSGQIDMVLGNGHQAIQGAAFGTVKNENGVIKYSDIRYYKANEVNPPVGVKAADWIAGGLKN